MHGQEDWGLLASRLLGGLYISCVGPFGVSGASYYWARVLAILGRATISIACREHVWQLIFADDPNLSAVGLGAIRTAVMIIFVMVLFGTPLLLTKAAGWLLSWVGWPRD